jgi:protein-serine/threonine kinase
MASFRPPTSAAQHGDNLAASDVASSEPQDSAMAMNDKSVDQNARYPISAPTSAFPFRTTTIAPSPPPTNFAKLKDSSTLSVLDTLSNTHNLDSHRQSPLSAPLHLQTDVIPGYSLTPATDNHTSSVRQTVESSSLTTNLITPPRTQSIKKALVGSVGAGSQFGSAPNSALSSPMLSAMADVTPLPSPLMSGDSPGPWRKLVSRPTSREYMMPGAADSALVTASGESITSAIVNQSKRRAYHGLITNATEPGPNDALINREKTDEGHSRNRSISEYVPETVQVPKIRHQTVSGSHAGLAESNSDCVSPSEIHMRRERNLAKERGIAPVHRQENILPTPPASRTGAESSDSDSSVSNVPITLSRTRKPRYEYFDAYTRNDEKRRRWRALKVLGQGTFSKVILATSQAPEDEDRIDENDASGDRMDGISHHIEPRIDRRKLVAIKICEHGPKGGASEERVEMSLKRELEIMKSIHHPCLVHLKAWNIEDTRAILVLSYCPGGDLFEVASEHHDLLIPSLLRRMFAELVAAVQYLHERHIVHRDIKLESKSSQS